MRIWAGVLLLVLIAAVANVIWKLVLLGYENIALVCVLVAMSVLLARGPSPSEMQRLLEWKGKRTTSSKDLAYTQSVLDRMVMQVVLVVLSAVLLLVLADDPLSYAPYIVAGLVAVVVLGVALLAASRKKRRDRPNKRDL